MPAPKRAEAVMQRAASMQSIWHLRCREKGKRQTGKGSDFCSLGGALRGNYTEEFMTHFGALLCAAKLEVWQGHQTNDERYNIGFSGITHHYSLMAFKGLFLAR